MSLRERVYSVLLVSSSENFNSVVDGLLPSSRFEPVHHANSINDARRHLLEREFDLIIINSPLPDESGVRFSIDCTYSQKSAVLVLSRLEVHENLMDKVSEYGVFTLPRPTSSAIISQALNWMISARERLRKTEQKAQSFEDKMEEIKLINRAKLLLISEMNLSEVGAHRFIEKNAMDQCISKVEIAKGIIDQYSK